MPRPSRVLEPVRIEVGQKRTAHVYGPKAWNHADNAQIPHMRCPSCRAMTIPANRVQDLATWIELRGKSVVIDSVLL